MKVIVKVNSISDEVMGHFQEINFKIDKILHSLNIVIGEYSGNIGSLSQLSFIDSVEIDELFELQSVKTTIQPNLHYGRLHKHNLLGNGIRIAMIDSGVNPEGIKFEDSIVFTDAINSHDSGNNGRLHGTYVANVIKSIAPWSRLYNLKVMNSYNEIWKSAILAAIDWCVINEISIVNISLGRKGACKPSCIVCNSLKKIMDKNGIAVVAMGNYGNEAISCPAMSKHAFSVGAVDQYKRLADYSSRGVPSDDKPNILAPGWIQITGDDPIAGTSFAAPYITGIIGCLLEKYSIKEVVEILQSTAIDLKLPRHHQGSGLVNIENIIGVINYEKTASSDS